MAKRDQRSDWHKQATAALPRPPFAIVMSPEAKREFAALPDELRQRLTKVLEKFALTGRVEDFDGAPALKPMAMDTPLFGEWRCAFGYDRKEREQLRRMTGETWQPYRFTFSPQVPLRRIIVNRVGPWAAVYRDKPSKRPTGSPGCQT